MFERLLEIFLLLSCLHCLKAIEPWMQESVNRDCNYHNSSICCSIVDRQHPHYTHKHSTSSGQGHLHSHHLHNSHNEHHCKITREYLPSPYEQKQMEIVEKINAMNNQSEDARYAVIRSVILNEYEASIEWLERVRFHMSLDRHDDKANDPKDLHYLSRFLVKKSCIVVDSHSRGIINQTWYEFIEPLTMFARDPRSFIGIATIQRDVNLVKDSNGKIPAYPQDDDFTQTKDYVLLQSGESAVLSRHPQRRQGKYYLFDAGTAFFNTSLAWFICGYLQRGISFDDIYAWEYEELNQAKYWNNVPPKIVPYLHFYNKGISSDYEEGHSILRIIDQRVQEEDFVAFKLDIDTSEIEMHVALELLKQPRYHKKIDEFFFELHFHCEVLAACCWERVGPLPAEVAGFKLTRYNALHYFQDLRKTGMRAHIWP